MTGAILFDLDCTLTDRPASIRRFAAELVASYGDAMTADADRVADVVAAADRCGYAPRSAVADAMRVELSWRKRPTAAELLAVWRARFPECAVVRDGVGPLPANLRAAGVGVGLVSNGAGDAQRRKLAAIGLAGAFDAVVISGEVGVRKPDAAIFRFALDQLGRAAADAWFVGDHPMLDVDGARRAGLRAVWLAGVHPWPGDLAPPEHPIDAIGQVWPLVVHGHG
jgi:putative hydrolase of the HAD superfamily